MRQELTPFFDRRLELSQAEAAGLMTTLEQDPALVRWLQEQTEMDDLLARLLQTERADFPNRMRVVMGNQPNDEAFIQRVRRANLRERQRPGRVRRFGPRHQAPAVAWIAAAAALALITIVGWSWWSVRHEGEVLDGRVEVDREAVNRVPSGSGFTVSDEGPAVIRLTGSSQARLFSQSEGILRHTQSSGDAVVELTSGGGDFQVEHHDGPLRIQAGVATITSADGGAHFSAELHPVPALAGEPRGATSAHHNHSPMELTVTVSRGKAQVDVHGQHHTISADDGHVFRFDGDGVMADQHVVRGSLKSLNPHSVPWTIAISDHGTVRSYVITPATQIRINATSAVLTDLHPNDRIEARSEHDAPTVISELVVRRTIPHHADDGEPHEHPAHLGDPHGGAHASPSPTPTGRTP